MKTILFILYLGFTVAASFNANLDRRGRRPPLKFVIRNIICADPDCVDDTKKSVLKECLFQNVKVLGNTTTCGQMPDVEMDLATEKKLVTETCIGTVINLKMLDCSRPMDQWRID
ncbi:uncharacterized protein LOC111084937 isoform X2 [Limulus polyphemus]|uniref:Uncharacterized protein LOC111084937 isoform X2 n=1 Tax=Limulus polyphemus TaxID=6850 RepID=A0ABM1S102_LIMPO|nr:uncharacterized protein LOC111084937 isoform X2 [Limulus polyphemus]